MNLDSLKIFFLKFWNWCKNYWQFIVGILSATAIFLFFQKRKSASPDVIDNLVTSHEAEININNQSSQIESDLIDSAKSKHIESINNIIDENNKEIIALENKETNRVNEILNNNKDNPDEITRRIGNIAGIRVLGDNK